MTRYHPPQTAKYDELTEVFLMLSPNARTIVEAELIQFHSQVTEELGRSSSGSEAWAILVTQRARSDRAIGCMEQANREERRIHSTTNQA